MKLLYGAMVLACAPLLLVGNDAVYPTEKIAAFVFEKVDVTTLPSAIRPKAGKEQEDIRRLRICGAGARRKKSAPRSATGGPAGLDRRLGSTEIRHLRLREQSISG